MGANESLGVVQRMQEAQRDRDFDAYAELIAEDAVFRMSGVPAGMGGVTTGRQAIVDMISRGPTGGTFEVKQQFADDEHACIVGKITADAFPGNDYLRNADRPYSAYECVVYRIADGKVAESTAFVNWLDPYVQVGLVDPSTLIR